MTTCGSRLYSISRRIQSEIAKAVGLREFWCADFLCLHRFEYQLQQVVGYRGLYARMEARKLRVGQMQAALRKIEERISKMSGEHARHIQDARDHRHRQQEISHQMLRVRVAMYCRVRVSLCITLCTRTRI